MEVTYIKLSELIGESIKIEKVFPHKFKAWDNEARKMLISDTWQQGYQKKYTVDTDKGRLDMSQSQIAQMLEGVCEDGRSDINGRRFSVKSNGEEGMKIRYFLNPIKEETETFEEELPVGW